MANYHYDNRKSYNNQPLKPGQAMIPVYVDWDMVRYYQMNPENLETWRIRGHKVLVAFTAVPKADKDNAMKVFWKDVRDHISMDAVDSALTSYESMTSGTADDHYAEDKSYEPQEVPSLERTTLIMHIIDELIEEVRAISHCSELVHFEYSFSAIFIYQSRSILSKYNWRTKFKLHKQCNTNIKWAKTDNGS